MLEIEKQVIELLDKGKSFSDISKILKVPIQLVKFIDDNFKYRSKK